MPDIIKFLDDFKDETLIPLLGAIKTTANQYANAANQPIEAIKKGYDVLVQPTVDAVNKNAILPATEYLNKVDDAAEGKVKDDTGQIVLVEDLPKVQQAAGAAFHVFNQVGQGVLATIEGMARGFEWLGVDSAKPVADKLQIWQKSAAIENPNFADSLAQGLGSAATFFLPGVGIGKGVGFFSRFSPRVAMLLGGSVSTALEALTEAGSVYQDALDSGSTKDQASKKATIDFWANAVLIGITNHLGIFNTDVGGLKKILLSAPLEGLQEFGQQVISNVSLGRQWDQGAYEAGAIGTILGGLLGTADFETKLPTPGEIDQKKKEIMKKTGLNETEAGKLMDYVNRLTNEESKTEKPDIFNQAVEEVRIENGEIQQAVNQAIKSAGVKIEVPASKLQTEQPAATEIYSVSTKTGDNIFTNNARLAQQANPNFITLNTSDLNIRTFRTEQEIRDYVTSQNTTTLKEALINEGKYDAYAIVDSKTGNVAYEVVDTGKLADTLASKQFISNKEAEQSFQSFRFVRDLGLPVQFQKNILTSKGKDALGKYSNTITEFINNPAKSTPSLEAVHAYLDLMVNSKEKQDILNEVKRRYKGKKLDDISAEEQLANDFIKYIQAKQNDAKAKAASSKLQRLFDWMMEQFSKVVKGSDKINKFYSDVISKKPNIKQRLDVASRIRRAMTDFSSVQEEYYQKPQELTTKFLEHPEVKNRDKASYSFLKNLLKSKSLPLKEAERVLIDDVLDTQFKDQKNIIMVDLIKAIQSELLPLEIIESDSYANYGLSNIERSEDDQRAVTYILNSPFEHGVTGHFSGDFEKRIFPEKVEIKQIPTTEKWAVIRKGVDLTEENISDNIFHVSPDKAGAEDWLNQRLLKQKTQETGTIDVSKKGLFSHFRSLGEYIMEIQSDTFQNLERVERGNVEKYFDLITPEEARKKFENGEEVFGIDSGGGEGTIFSKERLERAIETGERFGIEKAEPLLPKEEKQFFSYKNVWHERTIREAIRIKAMEGFDQVYFPKPYTVAKIEGYLSEDGQIPEGTEVGETFDYAGDDYILLTNEYDEAGKATRESDVRVTASYKQLRQKDIDSKKDDILSDLESNEYEIGKFSEFTREQLEEMQTEDEIRFDNIVGQIAESYVNDNYASAQGYADYWNEASSEDFTFDIGNGQIIILNNNNNVETLSFGNTAEKENFNYEEDLSADEQKTVLRFYDKQVYKYLKKFRKANLYDYTDENGFDWWATDIVPEDKAAVEAFQTRDAIEPEIVTGDDVAKYFKEISEEVTEGIDGEPGYDEYVYNLIKKGNYQLRRLKITDILDKDPDAADYVDDGINRYEEGQIDPITADNPIIIGYWDNGKKGVLDGYNRLLTKLNNDYKTIEAYVHVIDQSAREFISKNLSATGNNPLTLPNGDELYLDISETENTIYFKNIEISNTGAGTGTKIMDDLKRYSDITGKKITVLNAVNEDFFGRFSWLTANYGKQIGMTTFTYDPNARYQTIGDLTDDERTALELRRGEMMDKLVGEEVANEEKILNAREYSPNFSGEKYVGYENFKRLVRRRPWLLNAETDDAMLKRKIKNINIDNFLFSGANDMNNNELLDMFKNEYAFEKKQNEIAKEKTPTEQFITEKRASEKIVRNETIGRKPRLKQAINVATGNIPSEKITMTEKQLIKQRLRAIIQGVKMGRADMKAAMLDAFKTSYSEIQDIKKAIIEFAKPLPAADKGKLLNLVAKAKNKKDLVAAYVRIDNLLEASDKREALEQLKQTTRSVKYAQKTGKNIALDYQRQIMDIMQSYNIKSPVQKTIDKLKSLKDFIEKNPEIEIPKSVTAKLDQLLKKPVRELSTEGIRELNKMISHLASLGNLKLQLKNKYDERQRQISLEKLTASTRNIDNVKRGYLNTLHAFRVTDIMDGSQDYRGQNTRLQTKIARKVSNAELTSNALLDTVFSQISSFKGKWNEEEQAIMELYLLLDMKANTQAQQLIFSRNWKEMPKLTQEMEMAMSVMRGAFDKHVDNIAAVYEEHNNKEFERVDNYFPLKYTKKRGEIPEPTIGQTIARGKNVQQGFTFGRQKGVKRVPRTDVFAQFEEAIREQQYYLHVQPALLEVHSLVNDGKYFEAAGENAIQWWKDYIDAMSNKGRLSRSTHNPTLAKMRINLSRAILGYKLSSILIQPMAVFDALAYTYMRFGSVASARLLTHFAGAFIDPTYARRIKKLSPALQLRDGGELAIEEIQGGKERKGLDKVSSFRKFNKYSLSPLKWLDIRTAASVAQATYKTLRASGLDEQTARLESDVIMNITSGSSEIADRPMVLMGDELFRTVFTFQTFLLNRWGLIAHDLIGSGIKDGTITRKSRALIGLAILGVGGAFEDELRNAIYEAISGKKLPPVNIIKSALMTVPESIPILGQMLRSIYGYNQGYSIPLTRTIENVLVGLQMTLSDKEETKNKGILKVSEAVSTLFGVAGTSQGFDLLERALLDEKKTKKINRDIDMMPGIPEINFPSIPNIPSL